MLKPAVEPHLAEEPANLANSTKLMVTGADYFRDVGLHRQLTIEMDAETTNGLHRTSVLRQQRGSGTVCTTAASTLLTFRRETNCRLFRQSLS